MKRPGLGSTPTLGSKLIDLKLSILRKVVPACNISVFLSEWGPEYSIRGAAGWAHEKQLELVSRHQG